jgi:transposase
LISLDIWETIRIRCVRDNEPIKRVARELGISKNTVKKYVQANTPPLQKAPAGRVADMARFKSQVDDLLRTTPKITSARIAQIIRERYDPTFAIGERAVRMYVAARRARIVPKEAFVRLAYAPGDQVQFDFKDVIARIAGVEVALHMYVARLSYSTAFFARCYLSEDRPALFDGLVSACVRFGGVAREGVFDNASTAVKRILRGRERTMNDDFAAVCGALALRMQFAAPAKGNEKGGVEGLHGFIEDRFFRPVPEFKSLADLNRDLEAFAESYLDKRVSGESVRDRFERERSALRPLPVVLPATCVRDTVHINKFFEVTYKTNRYSVPSKFAHRDAVIEIFHDRIRVVVDGVLVAEPERVFGKHEAILDPLHFVDLLTFKHRAVVRAEVFRHRRFHHSLQSLLNGYVENDPASAGKRFMRVVTLLEDHPMHDLVNAVVAAAQRGTDDPAAIALLLRQEARPYQVVEPLRMTPGTRGGIRPVVNLDSYDITSLKESAQ